MSMLRQQLAAIVLASTAGCISYFAWNARVAAQDEKPRQPSKAGETAGQTKPTAPSPEMNMDKVTAAIDKMIAEYDLTPHPLAPIPDDPPPHEGAMISIPYVVEPSDLILVEVLEALPGRPISGERLLRPDGTISLGFYGDIHVKGLTLPQMKVAVIKLLRPYLEDLSLGLIFPDSELEPRPETPATKGPPSPQPQDKSPFGEPDKVKPRPSSDRLRSNPNSVRTRSASRLRATVSVPVRPVATQAKRKVPEDHGAPARDRNRLMIPFGNRQQVAIRSDGQDRPAAQPSPVKPPALQAEPVVVQDEQQWVVVAPEKSLAVYVDVTAYNTKNYHIAGDVLVPGRLPCTGHETVLDALQFAGGFLPTADTTNIRLVRPARGGKPAKVYKVDLAAIQERGDVTSNYQIFPGDRLIVGRNATVQKTVELDRLAAPIQTITAAMLQEASFFRAVQNASADHPDELLKELVDFWAKQLSQTGDLKFDEKALREIMMRKLKPSPAAGTTPAAK
jgi:protein involved in polysaccharide export with SLBB domain